MEIHFFRTTKQGGKTESKRKGGDSFCVGGGRETFAKGGSIRKNSSRKAFAQRRKSKNPRCELFIERKGRCHRGKKGRTGSIRNEEAAIFTGTTLKREGEGRTMPRWKRMLVRMGERLLGVRIFRKVHLDFD